MNMVEVSPPYDHADITAALANRVVLETLCAIARKRQDLRDGARWDPLQPLLIEPSAPIRAGAVQHHHTHLGHDQDK
jgi:agmatinase